jgi:hypothetical protein
MKKAPQQSNDILTSIFKEKHNKARELGEINERRIELI